MAGPCRWLAARPVTLFAVLWAVDALWFPYEHWVHDSRLYGLQVLNRISGGAFSGDLFLRYGSQDQYSPFSMLVAPLSGLLGLERSFFLLFLIFNALFVLAIMKLVRTLIADEVSATLALLVLAMSPLHYAGQTVFQVQENFFTARTIAYALGILGIERFCRRRYGTGLMYATGATAIHPLMGFGVLAVGIGCAALDRLPRRAAWWFFATAAAAVFLVIAFPPLGTSVFGTMDGDWLENVRATAPLNFPDLWLRVDWLGILASFAIVTWAAVLMMRESPERARVLLLTVVLGAVGVVATIVAARVPYRLLLQAQPYRALWIVQVLAIPLSISLACRLWQRSTLATALACLLGGFLVFPNLVALELIVVALVFCALVVLHNLPGRRQAPEGWLARSLIAAFLVGMLVVGIVKAIIVVLAARDRSAVLDPVVYGPLDPILFGLFFATNLGLIFWLGVVLWCLHIAMRKLKGEHALTLACLVLALSIHAAGGIVVRSHGYRSWVEPPDSPHAFIRGYFEQRGLTAQPLTVYDGALISVGFVWFDLGAKSYFNLAQLVGSIFSRETAAEARRRADIVRPFEIQRFAPFAPRFMPADRLIYQALFTPSEAVPPSISDLRRVCDEREGVDVAILREDFAHLAAAGDGRVFIYECAHVRARTES